MKVFHASYYWSGGYGAWDEYHLVVFATNEAEALGLALQARPESKATEWVIEEMLPTEAGDTSGITGVHFISSDGT